MDAHPFQSARSYLRGTPGAKWGAVLLSAAGSVLLALLLPVLYLFADLLVAKGRVPDYRALSAGRQQAFRDEWDRGLGQDPAVADALGRVRPAGPGPDGPDWDARWRAATRAYLADKVGPDAAEAYLPADGPGAPADHELGVLAAVARERGWWAGRPLAWFARWNGWGWRPGDSGSANVRYLTGLFLAGFGLLLARGLAVTAAARLATTAAVRAGVRLRRALYNHAHRVGAVAVRADAQEEAGDLVTRRVEQLQAGLGAWLTGTVRWQVLTTLLFVALLGSHFWLSLGCLLLAGLVWLVAGQAAAYFRRDARVAGRRADARLALMREAVAQTQLVKAYLMERYDQTRFERHLADLARATRRRQLGDAVSRPALLAVVALAGAAMLYLAGRVVLAGEMTVAGLAVKAAALAGLVFGVNRWIAARVLVARARDAAADVFEFLDRRGDGGQAIDAEFLQPLAKRLDLVGVSVREPGTGRMVLEDVSLTVPAGAKAAVVFGDPAEAHALAHVVTRFADPTAGEVRVDGKNLRWATTESVRTQVALVLEHSLTFADTVANNIGCGDPGYTLPQIIEAAKVAHAHGFVQRLPYGYETVIGDGGVGLKPGERFRIALARAALRDPSLLVIEEPAEPLDPDSLALIDDAVARLQAGRTILFLARRPATVRAADRVFVLRGGRLAAADAHDSGPHNAKGKPQKEDGPFAIER